MTGAPARKDGAKKSETEAKTSAKTAFDWSTLFVFPKAIGWRDHAVGALFALVYVWILVVTARTLGFARDESFYFSAGQSYARWVDLLLHDSARALDKGAIDGTWGQNHEHPALMKTLFGLSHLWFYEKWKLFTDASTSFRFPAMLTSGMALWVTYLFGARVYSRRAGFIAAVLLAAIPQLFYNAHLACFDAPIMAMWLLAVYIYWRSTQVGGWKWALAAGVVYGLTLDTKHNAWILPAVFVPHAIVVQVGAALRARGSKDAKQGGVTIPLNILSIAVVGPLVCWALWPWLWSDTQARVQEWLSFHLHHVYYNMEFLGKNYYDAPSPRAYMPVLVMATVPAITMLLFFVGAFERLRAMTRELVALVTKKDDALSADTSEPDVLVFLALSAPLAVFLLPTTPIFGGTKHWLPAYPFLAMLAGHGFDLAAKKADAAMDTLANWTDQKREIAHGVMIALVLVAPIAETGHSHPFGIGAYVPTVGGTQGAADLGLNRQFWGYTTQSVGPWFEKNAPRNARVFIHDTTGDAFARMEQEGRIRGDLHAVGSPGDADIALVQHELHMNEVDDQIWVAYQNTAPVYVVTHDGVPFVSVYKRR